MFGRATIRLGIGPHSSYLFVWCAYSDDPTAAAARPPSQEVHKEGTSEAASHAEEVAADFRPDDDDAR